MPNTSSATSQNPPDSDEFATIDATRKFIRNREVEDAAQSKDVAEKIGVAVIPETAASATGFAKPPGSANGLYLMVDVGAMTLDACTFRLNRNKIGRNQYPLLGADVRPLGVEAFYWFKKAGRTEREFEEQCERSLHSLIWGTRRDRDPRAGCWRAGNVLPVFLTGGGSRNDLHRRIVEQLGPWLKRHTHNEGIRPVDLPTPRTIILPEKLPSSQPDFGRLAVAWGLSYPSDEIGEIMPMSEIDDIPPPTARDIANRFVGPEQV